MKFKLSYKIFATLTLTSLLVVVLMVGLIRFYVARDFADYANKSLLERYSDFAAALATEYQTQKGWQALKKDTGRWWTPSEMAFIAWMRKAILHL